MTLLLGLGIIGSRCADNLIAAGIDLKTWNRTPKDRADSVTDLSAADADIVLCYLMDEHAVKDVFSQIAPSLGEGKTFINHATIDPETTMWLDAQCRALGCDFLDCPFTGSKDASAGGNLVYYVSGKPELLEKHRSLLEITSREIMFLGPPPAATVVKITTNLVTASTVTALAEALEISRRHGVDPRDYEKALQLNASYAPVHGLKTPSILDDDFEAHFSTKNMLKDARFSEALAAEAGAHAPGISTVSALLEQASGHAAEEDFSSLVKNEPYPADFAPLGPRAIIEAYGPDAARYLNGQISNDIALTESGDTISACLLDAKGGLECFVYLRKMAESYIIDAPISEREILMARLDKYLIADDVTLTDVSDELHISHSLDEAAGSKANRFGMPGADFITDEEPEHSFGTFEGLRIFNGAPKWPNELFPGILPAEAGLEESAISFTKGCYTGQEVVSRMKRAGKVNRKLVKLVLNKPLIPKNSRLMVDGKEAGVITSVTRFDSTEIALGYLKRKFEDAEEFQVISPSADRVIGSAKLR
ncbi:NAD(P)-binding domain-containing protein [Akkermansiaceae bacterium]|nr:NAD(P)-binding domain-containing protein [Akkermansiaceae bacterium]MDA7674858.1 NAD(P)-binding domain-containing protein [Akkermansiaceae bacterium]MDB0056798.1 NAD(P)-binding domain-containing protein [Akkermansiaceae bacterium]MDB4265606.1 NAD(P)-binding domain-containing protein [Akkermansiaceae bacterium]MDB4320234.1 NAD(P)-binding domain-containing protein [Akkermansiaceae bacterium]